jgi:hypothetical protein
MVDDVDQLPRIPWSEVEDDHSEDRMGYSFLTDDRNREWVKRGENWVMNQIIDTQPHGQGQAQRKVWIANERRGGKPFQARAVQSYGQTFNGFMERMFMLMYMMSQPGRVTEITSVRHQNTMDGGVRNMLAHSNTLSPGIPGVHGRILTYIILLGKLVLEQVSQRHRIVRSTHSILVR